MAGNINKSLEAMAGSNEPIGWHSFGIAFESSFGNGTEIFVVLKFSKREEPDENGLPVAIVHDRGFGFSDYYNRAQKPFVDNWPTVLALAATSNLTGSGVLWCSVNVKGFSESGFLHLKTTSISPKRNIKVFRNGCILEEEISLEDKWNTFSISIT